MKGKVNLGLLFLGWATMTVLLFLFDPLRTSLWVEKLQLWLPPPLINLQFLLLVLVLVAIARLLIAILSGALVCLVIWAFLEKVILASPPLSYTDSNEVRWVCKRGGMEKDFFANIFSGVTVIDEKEICIDRRDYTVYRSYPVFAASSDSLRAKFIAGFANLFVGLARRWTILRYPRL